MVYCKYKHPIEGLANRYKPSHIIYPSICIVFSVWDKTSSFILISGCVASRGSLDGERNESRASMQWTSGPPDRNQVTCIKWTLSEIIRAIDLASYNG